MKYSFLISILSE